MKNIDMSILISQAAVGYSFPDLINLGLGLLYTSCVIATAYEKY